MAPSNPHPARPPGATPSDRRRTRRPDGATGETRGRTGLRGFPRPPSGRPERRTYAAACVDFRTRRPRPRGQARRPTEGRRDHPGRKTRARREGGLRRDGRDRRDADGQDARGLGRPAHPRATRRRRRDGRIDWRGGVRRDCLRRKATGALDGGEQQWRPHPALRRPARNRRPGQAHPPGAGLPRGRADRALPRWAAPRSRLCPGQRPSRPGHLRRGQEPRALRTAPHRRRQCLPPGGNRGDQALRLRLERRTGRRLLPRRHRARRPARARRGGPPGHRAHPGADPPR